MNRLLYLDDSRFFPAMLSSELRSAGWTITEEPEEAEALLVDPSWHEDRGYRVLSSLREKFPEGALPIVALLASSSSEARACLRELGICWSVKGRLKASDLSEYINVQLKNEMILDKRLFGSALASVIAGTQDVDSRPYLLPSISGALLQNLTLVKTISEALEVCAHSLCEHFPVLIIGISAYGENLIACLAAKRAQSMADQVRSLMGWEPNSSNPCLIEYPESYPLLNVDLEKVHVSNIQLKLSSTHIVFISAVDDNYILEFLEQTLEDIDKGLSVINESVKLANAERKIFRVFSRFLPGVVIDDLVRKRSDAALLTGEKRQIVALFSHIRDFSHYVEENDPSDLVRFLNRHFSLYARIIRKHGGFINKYIGDAVFAIFGAPLSYLDNARRALAASIEIQEELARMPLMDIHYPADGYHAGIGLNDGQAIVGNIGSHDSFDYTAIGDTINLAARLESLCKHYKTSILLSDDFRIALERQEDTHHLRLVDCARVKGKQTPTIFYTIYGTEEIDPAFDQLYRKGLSMFRLGNWLIAVEYFIQAQTLWPHDHLCNLYVERCLEFMKTPPLNWDGAVTLGFK